MKKLFCLLSLLMLSASAYAVQGWMWFNQFPWVYSDEDKNWLYITPEIEVSTYDSSNWQRQASSYISNMGWVWVYKYPFIYSNKEKDWLHITPKNSETLYAFGAWNKKWKEFEIYQHDWDKQYEEWIKNPEPYGGLSVLQQIKEAKDIGLTDLELPGNNISDITPLAGLTNLTGLVLFGHNISDLTPLAGLTNLTSLRLTMNNISDLTPLAGLTNLIWLHLDANNISDITPLAGLTNLRVLDLNSIIGGNPKISDITPLVGLTNLTELYLNDNNISDSQKALLEQALPNTDIFWND